jgi:hypothetical protein
MITARPIDDHRPFFFTDVHACSFSLPAAAASASAVFFDVDVDRSDVTRLFLPQLPTAVAGDAGAGVVGADTGVGDGDGERA